MPLVVMLLGAMHAQNNLGAKLTRGLMVIAVFGIGSLAVVLGGCDMANQAMQTANNAANGFMLRLGTAGERA